MPRLRRLAKIVVVTLAGAYLALVLAAFLGQRAITYPVPDGAREPQLAGATLLRLPGPGGSTVYALHVPAPPGAATVVHFHGNAEQLADGVPLAALYRAAGLGYFEVEYPGYGLAKAQKPTEAAIYAAAEVALAHLTGSLKVPRAGVVLEGQSLGTGVAIEMARRGHGARLSLISPYTSIADIGRRILPILPGDFLVLDRFDSAAKAPLLSIPSLVVHGTADEVIPVDMGERIARLIPGATVRLVEGAHHGDILASPGVMEALVEFARAATP
ncbi:MAG: alpha/beta hydrolase [Myxococcaceae bacterium]